MLDLKALLIKVLQQFSTISTQFSTISTQLTNLMPTRGSNANGEWVKYPDGTMICWGYKTVQSSTSATSAYFKYYGTVGATFPQSFASTPRVVSNIQKAAHYWNTTVTSASASSCTLYAAGNTNTSCIVDYIAVGRWK